MTLKLNTREVVICMLGISVLGSSFSSISYLEDLNVSYVNGQWVCVFLHCPSRTFGCHIRRWTDVDNKLLHSNYTCFDENKEFIVSVDETVEMLTNRDIDIDLESYVGAESDYSMGYRYAGYESAQGTVSPSGWSELKESAKNTRNTVESMKTFK